MEVQIQEENRMMRIFQLLKKSFFMYLVVSYQIRKVVIELLWHLISIIILEIV